MVHGLSKRTLTFCLRIDSLDRLGPSHQLKVHRVGYKQNLKKNQQNFQGCQNWGAVMGSHRNGWHHKIYITFSTTISVCPVFISLSVRSFVTKFFFCLNCLGITARLLGSTPGVDSGSSGARSPSGGARMCPRNGLFLVKKKIGRPHFRMKISFLCYQQILLIKMTLSNGLVNRMKFAVD